MTALAAILMIGGLLFAVLFVVGTVVFFGMMIHAEVSYARTRRVEESVHVPEPARPAPARSGTPAPQMSRTIG